MKKRKYLSLVMSVCIFSVIGVKSANAEWTLMASAEEGSHYVDVTTIVTSPDNPNWKRMWSLLDLPDAFPENEKLVKGMRSMTIYVECDCDQNRRRYIATTVYSGNMGSGEVLHSNNYVSDWNYLRPGTRGFTRLSIACGWYSLP